MDELPIEIFLSITSNLTFKEKSVLSNTNHFLHNLIKNTALFHSLTIKKNPNFLKFLDYFQHNDHLRSQVKNLKLFVPSSEVNQVLSLPALFPHLEDFVWENYSNQLEQNFEFRNGDCSWEHIKSFEETNYNPMSKNLLQFGYFKNLTKLKINFHLKYQDCSELFQYLNMAPRLNRLELAYIKLNLNTMEILHANAPNLEILHLINITVIEETESQGTLSVSNSLKSLKIFQMKLRDNITTGIESNWLNYISRKYLNLESLNIGSITTLIEQPYYEHDITEILIHLRQLKLYKIDLPLTHQILSTMNQCKIELKELTIHTLNELEYVCASNQIYTVESMAIKLNGFGQQDILGYLQQFQNLQHLKITGKSVTVITIDKLLTTLNQLKSIKIDFCDVDLSSSIIVPENNEIMIETIELSKVGIKNTLIIDKFISPYCLNLTTFILNGQGNQDTIQIHFSQQCLKLISIYIFLNQFYKINGTAYQVKNKSLKIIDNIDSNFISIQYRGSTTLQINGISVPKW